MGVLCGNHGAACYAKYGAYPLRGKHCHEMALRLLLGSIDSHAARYKRYATFFIQKKKKVRSPGLRNVFDSFVSERPSVE
ncbi:N2,N2-dimethylguanosine tRNA methyltransferase-domain-containing protein [Pavlovales sp. CCMP2436]|nr:N2,N2-dimethylguanosine tRNA methyltransferase-domain-containing protein [Pavlovales sp. CCMP2436]